MKVSSTAVFVIGLLAGFALCWVTRGAREGDLVDAAKEAIAERDAIRKAAEEYLAQQRVPLRFDQIEQSSGWDKLLKTRFDLPESGDWLLYRPTPNTKEGDVAKNVMPELTIRRKPDGGIYFEGDFASPEHPDRDVRVQVKTKR